MLLQAAALLAAEGALPINLRIVCDGEEEIGGHSIVEFLPADERGADVCVIFDSGMVSRDLPAFNVATRGLAAFHLRVRTGARDLHSGMYGERGAERDPRADGDARRHPPARRPRAGAAARRASCRRPTRSAPRWEALPSGADVLRDAGAVPYDERAAEEFYLRTTAETSVDVNGILGG